MHFKAIGILILLIAIGLKALAQTTREQIEKAHKDPRRAENEARADRKLQEKNRVISDAPSTETPGKKKIVKKIEKRKKAE